MAGDSGDAPRLVVVCGVAGSGKSTLARELAHRCGLCYLEGDDFHSPAAKARMASGLPLDDVWRTPWIEAIGAHLRDLAGEGNDCVLAFSGLRRSYRERLRHIGFRSCFLLLDAPHELIRQRLLHRKGHFMPAILLESQFNALESPAEEEDVIELDASPPIEEVVAEALQWLAPLGLCRSPAPKSPDRP